MARSPKRDKTREKSSIIAAKNRRELIAAGLNRRDLLKMGLLTSAGMLIPKLGLSARPLTSAGYVDDTPQSRPTTPFVEDMPRLQIKQPVANAAALTGPDPQAAPNTLNGESRTVAHQAFAQFPPQKYYEIHQKAFQAKSSPDFVQTSTLWGFDGIFPGPLFVARYGEPILVRQFNDLPSQNNGFGLNSTTTHLHNGHTPSESDGYPCYFSQSGKWYDHHYPNVLAGVNSTHIAQGGDIRESMHSLWYHDHRIDFTAQNVYKGSPGCTTSSTPKIPPTIRATRTPASNSRASPTTTSTWSSTMRSRRRDRPLAFDLFNLDGILGDKMLSTAKCSLSCTSARAVIVSAG